MGGQRRRYCFLSSLVFLLFPPFATSNSLFQLLLNKVILMPPFLNVLDSSLLKHWSLPLTSGLGFPVAFIWDSLMENILSPTSHCVCELSSWVNEIKTIFFQEYKQFVLCIKFLLIQTLRCRKMKLEWIVPKISQDYFHYFVNVGSLTT